MRSAAPSLISLRLRAKGSGAWVQKGSRRCGRGRLLCGVRELSAEPVAQIDSSAGERTHRESKREPARSRRAV